MTEKRFTNIEHDYENARIRCNDNGLFMLYAIYEDDDGLTTLGDLLNGLDGIIKDLSDDYQKLLNENEQLKQRNNVLSDEIIAQGIVITGYQNRNQQLFDENEKLKQSATMYYTLFTELQKMLNGVKRASDLDSKDFNDLLELSKGNVFDDNLGWVHLPIKGAL